MSDRADRPTRARPGSEAKIRVMTDRASAGLPLFNAADADYAGRVGPGKAKRTGRHHASPTPRRDK